MALLTPWETFLATEGGIPATLINPVTTVYDPTADNSDLTDGDSVDVIGLYYQGGPAGRQLTGASGTDVVYSAVFLVPIKSLQRALQDKGLWFFPLQPARTTIKVNGVEYSTGSMRTRWWRGNISAYEFDLGR